MSPRPLQTAPERLQDITEQHQTALERLQAIGNIVQCPFGNIVQCPFGNLVQCPFGNFDTYS